jgi:hypothetical protein
MHIYRKLDLGSAPAAHHGHRYHSRGVTAVPASAEPGYIASDGHGGVWLSAYGTNGGAPYLYHYNGGRWSRTATPTEKGYRAEIFALAAISGTTSVWAAGELASTVNNQLSKAVIWRYGA